MYTVQVRPGRELTSAQVEATDNHLRASACSTCQSPELTELDRYYFYDHRQRSAVMDVVCANGHFHQLALDLFPAEAPDV